MSNVWVTIFLRRVNLFFIFLIDFLSFGLFQTLCPFTNEWKHFPLTACCPPTMCQLLYIFTATHLIKNVISTTPGHLNDHFHSPPSRDGRLKLHLMFTEMTSRWNTLGNRMVGAFERLFKLPPACQPSSTNESARWMALTWNRFSEVEVFQAEKQTLPLLLFLSQFYFHLCSYAP